MVPRLPHSVAVQGLNFYEARAATHTMDAKREQEAVTRVRLGTDNRRIDMASGEESGWVIIITVVIRTVSRQFGVTRHLINDGIFAIRWHRRRGIAIATV